jgi:hypothetical protein
MPYFVGANDRTPVDTSSQGSFLGGDGSGTTVSLTAGALSDASFSPDPPNGNSQTSLLTVNAVAVGGAVPLSFEIGPGPVNVVSRKSYDLLIEVVGIDSTINDSSIQQIGPVTLRRGSTRQVQGQPLNFQRGKLSVGPIHSRCPAGDRAKLRNSDRYQ